MREIKFRAWDSFNKKMLSWEQFKNIKFDVGDGYDVGIPLEILDEKYQKQHNLIPQQFTGLIDKNGKEIYEGDVVKTPQQKYIKQWVVEYDIDGNLILDNGVNSEFCLYDFEDMTLDKENCYTKDIEVIGNIYEDKHLLDN